MIIHDSTTISELREEFSRHFPYLKLEFFEFDPNSGKAFSKKNLITNDRKTLGEIRHIHFSGPISIDGHQKVGTLEKNFREQFGMYVQVFRRSGKRWLETTITDQWTLAEQNRQGEEMSRSTIESNQVDFDEYHEQQ